MLTRIEIDGFKSFSEFELNLNPFSAVVGPNASGKSNLFDAIKFLSLLAHGDVNTAMRSLRGEPSELFRNTPNGPVDNMTFSIEVFLPLMGIDNFGNIYGIKAQRLRYSISISIRKNKIGRIDGVFVSREFCHAIKKTDDTHTFIKQLKPKYAQRKNPLLETVIEPLKNRTAFHIRQDGDSENGSSKRGRPLVLSAVEASASALSTVTTPEFPHLYALRQFLTSIQFLEINPTAARSNNDRFETKELKPDASNLAAVLSRLKHNRNTKAPGAIDPIAEISADLTSLIPSVKSVIVEDDPDAKEYSFSVRMADGDVFSSRIISDGTLRLLALLAIINDPRRSGVLCFEEPENGVHEGRIARLVDLLRSSSVGTASNMSVFQILLNTHSPAVMASLNNEEIIAADVETVVNVGSAPYRRTRMRTDIRDKELFDHKHHMTRETVESILRKESGGV